MAKKELDRFDTKAKRDMQISTKLVLIIGAAVIASCVGIATISLFVFDHNIVSDTKDRLKITADGANTTLADWEVSLTGYSATISDRPDLLDAIGNEDYHSLQNIVTDKANKFGVDFMAVTDKQGVVLQGGGYRINAGKNISSVNVVKRALAGIPSSSHEEVSDMSYTVCSAYPIRQNGNVLGCVITGYDLSNGDFVSAIQDSYNVECTILKSNIRVASTLRDENGNSVAGTSVDNPDITSAVLTRGEDYEDVVTIFNQKYVCSYVPLKLSDGRITGMIFVAESLASVNSIKNKAITLIIPTVIAFVIVIMILCYFFIRWLMWRIYNVTNFLKEMETGDADLTKRVKLLIRDEIGDLVIHFDFFCDRLQKIVSEIKESKQELSLAGNDMSSSTQDAASAITQIIANIDGIHNQIRAQGSSVQQTANAVDEISDNITTLDSMIESQSNGVSQASVAVEQMIGNISSVNSSVDKMASSFESLSNNAQTGFTKQQAVNDRIKQIETQSEMLQEANQAISSIAEQTNLLAMNAAIEAAHAGEAGKGFAVVADEIRKLSETSTAQSRTIGEQLNNIKDSISEVVAASQESSEAFTAVSNKIKETDELVIQIKAAMDEQNAGSKQISQALKNMNDSTVEVHNASKEMSNRNQKILHEMHTLQEVTTNMMQSMDEMSNGAKRINETGTELGDISNKVQSSIIKIGQQIDLFKV